MISTTAMTDLGATWSCGAASVPPAHHASNRSRLAAATGSISSPLGERTYVKRPYPSSGDGGRHHELPSLGEQPLGLGGRIVDPVAEVVDARALVGSSGVPGEPWISSSRTGPVVENVSAIGIDV